MSKLIFDGECRRPNNMLTWDQVHVDGLDNRPIKSVNLVVEAGDIVTVEIEEYLTEESPPQRHGSMLTTVISSPDGPRTIKTRYPVNYMHIETVEVPEREMPIKNTGMTRRRRELEEKSKQDHQNPISELDIHQDSV